MLLHTDIAAKKASRRSGIAPLTAEHGEEGYLLLTVLVLVFLLLMFLSVAAPRVAKEIQRDKEEETLQRGLQYERAIRLYYKKFGNYPTDIKQLENTNEIRFLRKRYTDPMTGKDDWRIIHPADRDPGRGQPDYGRHHRQHRRCQQFDDGCKQLIERNGQQLRIEYHVRSLQQFGIEPHLRPRELRK